MINEVSEILAEIYKSDSRRILATLIRLLGDFDLAEDALHTAFRVAVEKWPEEGIPQNPYAWLISTGRFKAIDAIRRSDRTASVEERLRDRLLADMVPDRGGQEDIEDDRLRLIFICCHPALAAETRVALTLREVCGLTTEEIARAFLLPPSTLAQRIVRAKAKIRSDNIPYQVPGPEDLEERLGGVLQVIYLIFNEGYYASSGAHVTRTGLSGEAIRLGQLLTELLPDSETFGLLALMLLQESRRAARITDDGDLILLEDQNRSLWDWEQIAEGVMLLNKARAFPQYGVYTIQASIAAVHATARVASVTDWRRVVDLYDVLMRIAPSPVVELNRAVGVAMRDGPLAGLQLIDSLLGTETLTNYHLAHSARADMCRRLGQKTEARISYERALELARQEPERRFIRKRLAELD